MQISVTVEIVVRVCPVCGVHYGMDQVLYERRRRDGGDWYCTNGHRLGFGDSEVEKLRKQLASAQGNLQYYREYSERREAEVHTLNNQVRAQKAAKTRLLRRVTNGACPCCKRHFANVERHMKTRHPGEVVGAGEMDGAH